MAGVVDLNAASSVTDAWATRRFIIRQKFPDGGPVVAGNEVPRRSAVAGDALIPPHSLVNRKSPMKKAVRDLMEFSIKEEGDGPPWNIGRC